MAETKPDCASVCSYNSAVNVKKISSFLFKSKIKFWAAVNTNLAWIALEEIDFDDTKFTQIILLDQTGKTSVSITLSGKVSALAADGWSNCYVARDKQVMCIDHDGNIQTLITDVGATVSQLSCRKVKDSYQLMLLFEKITEAVGDMCFGNSFEYKHTCSVSKYDLERSTLEKCCIIDQNDIVYSIPPKAFLHFDTIAVAVVLGNNHEYCYFYNMNGVRIHVSYDRIFHRKTAFLSDLHLDHNGITRIDVAHSEFFKRKLKDVPSSATSPAEILLEAIVESCFVTSPRPCTKGFNNSMWTIHDGVVSIFECQLCRIG